MQLLFKTKQYFKIEQIVYHVYYTHSDITFLCAGLCYDCEEPM